MRRLSPTSLVAFVSLIGLAATLGCSDSALTAPRPRVVVPWGPLGTGDPNECGEADIRIVDPESALRDTLPIAQGFECPPPDAEGNWCPATGAISYTYQLEFYIGPIVRIAWGFNYATYEWSIRSLTDPNQVTNGMVTLNMIQCAVMKWGGDHKQPR